MFSPEEDKLRFAIMNPTANLRAESSGGFYANGGVIPERFSKPVEKKPLIRDGLISGPGTGTSDSIQGEAEPESFIIPANVVEAYGPDKLQAIVNAVIRRYNLTKSGEEVVEESGEEMDDNDESSENTPVQVSNGEFKVPDDVVEATGVDFWQTIVDSVNGPRLRTGDQPGEEEKKVAAELKQNLEQVVSGTINRNSESIPNALVNGVKQGAGIIASDYKEGVAGVNKAVDNFTDRYKTQNPVQVSTQPSADQFAQQQANGITERFKTPTQTTPGLSSQNQLAVNTTDPAKVLSEDFARRSQFADQQTGNDFRDPANNVYGRSPTSDLTKDGQGFRVPYPEVNGKSSGEAVVIPFDKNDLEYLSHALPAQQYNNILASRRLYQDQANLARPGYSESQEDSEGNKTTFAQDSFQPSPYVNVSDTSGGYSSRFSAQNANSKDPVAAKFRTVTDENGKPKIIPISGDKAQEYYADQQREDATKTPPRVEQLTRIRNMLAAQRRGDVQLTPKEIEEAQTALDEMLK